MKLIALIIIVVVSAWLWDEHPVATVIFVLISASLIGYVLFALDRDQKEYQERLAKMTTEEREAHQKTITEAMNTMKFGPKSEHVICSHCHAKGTVRSMAVLRDAKYVTGNLARIETTTSKAATQLHCDACQLTWDI